MRQIRKLVIHCSATRAGEDIGAAEIRRWHVDRNGWADIGYHFIIRRSGLIETGRPVEAPGAHVAGHNHDSIGICMVGGIGPDGKAECNFTADQFDSLRNLLEHLLAQYPGATVCGHRDLSPDTDGDGVVEQHEWMKQCPTFDAKVFMNA